MTVYRGPIGVGSEFVRGDKRLRVVGDFCPQRGWPYSLVRVGGYDAGPDDRRYIPDDQLRRDFEPAGAVVA